MRFNEVEATLVAELKKCIPDINTGSSTALHIRRVEMWRKYHQLRTSPSFSHLWTTFTIATSSPAEPTFFQEVTEKLFNDLVLAAFPVQHTSAASLDQEVTYDYVNVIRYIAGYVRKYIK